jgi:hypothetical protein
MRLTSRWDEEYTDEESISIAKDLALYHARLGGTEGERIAGCITSGDYHSLCNWVFRYAPDAPVSELYECRQAVAFFSKACFVRLPGVDQELVAWRKYQEAESLCRETNVIFRSWSRGEFSFSPRVESVLFRAQRKISRILGDVPKLSQLKLRFGPGATTRTKKRDASTREKLQAGVSCSEELFPYASRVLEEMPSWLSSLDDGYQGLNPDVALVPVVVETGRLSFVPKNAKTHRAIVTEPVLNGMVQLGIGSVIQKRLLAFGVDLGDQSHNQRLAREGSLTGALATLDLSSASDTISRELVYNLLPLDWAVFLNAARTRKVSYKGAVINQEKFSSMGNGFTFPLESLIFYALTASCCEANETVSVYGDDIICPTSRVDLVREVLHAVGFVINTDKSYWTGVFRESCGADYFRGFDIRPFYQKNLVSPASLFVLHNFYVRNYQSEMAENVLKLIHPSLRIYGPDLYGDGHLLGVHLLRPHKREAGYGGYLFDTFTKKSRRDVRPSQPGDCVLPFYSTYVGGYEAAISAKGFERFQLAPLALDHGPDGSNVVVKPGYSGYKRISVYTLTPSY